MPFGSNRANIPLQTSDGFLPSINGAEGLRCQCRAQAPLLFVPASTCRATSLENARSNRVSPRRRRHLPCFTGGVSGFAQEVDWIAPLTAHRQAGGACSEVALAVARCERCRVRAPRADRRLHRAIDVFCVTLLRLRWRDIKHPRSPLERLGGVLCHLSTFAVISTWIRIKSLELLKTILRSSRMTVKTLTATVAVYVWIVWEPRSCRRFRVRRRFSSWRPESDVM